MKHAIVLAALLIAACTADTQEPVADSRSIEAVADDYLAAYLERYPELLTYYAIDGAGHDRLTDNSLAALKAWQQNEDQFLAELGAIGEPRDVGSRDWVTYGILYEELASAVDSRICRSELWSASTTTAWYRDLPFVFDVQPLDSPELRGQALTRLLAVETYVNNEIENLRSGLELGYSAPRVTVEKVPVEARTLLEDNNPFLAMGARADDADFEAEVQSIFEDRIGPAIEAFASFIETEYLPAAREKIALTENPDGAECYPALVRSFATVSPPADEIHELGLSQVDKIRAEMQVVIDAHYGGGSIEEFLRRLNDDPEFTFRSEDDVLQYSVNALDAAKAAMPEVFGLMPKANVLVKPYPEFAASGVGEYHPSSEDGTRPGIFYIAVINPENRTRATQKSTLYHETFPGHHLQIALKLELGDAVHTIARYLGNSGFSEGWGLYSERLAEELDLYSDPIDMMGLYSDQGARAARLVVDSGLHTKDWSRQQAVDYMLANTGWSEADIQSDVNRYISWPGQANSYMLGMIEMQKLRGLAEQELGDAFDIREFHDRVLENGSLTLPMLNTKITRWIEDNRQ